MVEDMDDEALQESQDVMPESFTRVESMNHAMRTAQLGENPMDIVKRASMYYQYLAHGKMPEMIYDATAGRA